MPFVESFNSHRDYKHSHFFVILKLGKITGTHTASSSHCREFEISNIRKYSAVARIEAGSKGSYLDMKHEMHIV